MLQAVLKSGMPGRLKRELSEQNELAASPAPFPDGAPGNLTRKSEEKVSGNDEPHAFPDRGTTDETLSIHHSFLSVLMPL